MLERRRLGPVRTRRFARPRLYPGTAAKCTFFPRRADTCGGRRRPPEDGDFPLDRRAPATDNAPPRRGDSGPEGRPRRAKRNEPAVARSGQRTPRTGPARPASPNGAGRRRRWPAGAGGRRRGAGADRRLAARRRALRHRQDRTAGPVPGAAPAVVGDCAGESRSSPGDSQRRPDRSRKRRQSGAQRRRRRRRVADHRRAAGAEPALAARAGQTSDREIALWPAAARRRRRRASRRRLRPAGLHVRQAQVRSAAGGAAGRGPRAQPGQHVRRDRPTAGGGVARLCPLRRRPRGRGGGGPRSRARNAAAVADGADHLSGRQSGPAHAADRRVRRRQSRLAALADGAVRRLRGDRQSSRRQIHRRRARADTGAQRDRRARPVLSRRRLVAAQPRARGRADARPGLGRRPTRSSTPTRRRRRSTRR